MRNQNITILHVEDEPVLAQLVRTAFIRFGFRGTMLTAERVGRCLTLLDERARQDEPIHLIISDMQLPDGTGLDLVRKVRESPHWQFTPIVVLSGETAPRLVTDAYALGINCYIPKVSSDILHAVRSLYRCWIENAILPQESTKDRSYQIFARATHLRSRTSEVYRQLATMEVNDPEESRFWLERSLTEGNFSNLLALFRNSISKQDVPAPVLDRLSIMQDAVESSLVKAEKWFQCFLRGDLQQGYALALDLLESVDETVLTESLGYLFAKDPAATLALRERATAQIQAISNHVLNEADEPALKRRAERLQARAEIIAQTDLESQPSSLRYDHPADKES